MVFWIRQKTSFRPAWVAGMQVLCLVAALLTSEGIAAKDLHETAYMKLGREAAPWIPRIMDILESRRPPRWYADQIAVIKGAEGQQYLVVIWKGRRYKGEWVLRTPHIEFHKYIETPDGKPKLKFLREFHGYRFIELLPPTGEVITDSGAPVVVVHLDSGGMAHFTSEKRIIEMRRNTVDITPSIRVTHVIDLDDDGSYEVISNDDIWLGYFDGRSRAGPVLRVLLKRRDGKFYLACQSHPTFYREWLASIRQNIKDVDDWKVPEPRRRTIHAEYLAEAILVLAQIAAFDEAYTFYDKMKALYRDNEEVDGPSSDDVLSHFKTLLEKAKLNENSACPASVAESEGGQYGFLERAESFRIPDASRGKK